ncbi:MAG: LPS assembly lipoprotein LptE [Arenicellales bacterium]|jgi:LPS-assembly lipoprotein
MTLRTLILILTAGALVSSCGFHLRGNLPLPEDLKVVAVSSDNRQVRDEMVNALEASGAQVVEDQATARAVMDMYKVTFERKVRTIDTRGKVTGYVLRYDVSYRIIRHDGKQLRDTHLAIQRDYNFDPNQVLQAEEEENSLKEDMLKELTQRIMRQLVTVASRTIGTPGPLERARA